MALAAAYVAAALIGFLAAPIHHAVSSAWPPAGIAVAALVLFGRRLWPGILLGAFVANLLAAVALPAALVIAGGNTLEALTALWMLQRAGFRPSMDRLRDVLALGIAAILASIPAASIGVFTLAMAGSDPYGGLDLLWLLWFTGDAIGIAVVAPLALTWLSGPRLKLTTGIIEPTLLVLGLGVLTGLVVGRASPFVYPVFPLAGLAAYRLGPRGAAVANVTVGAVAAFFTIQGVGSFVAASASPGQNLFLFQAFVALLSITTLSSAAVLTERRNAEADLRESQAHLTEAQTMAQVGSWRWEPANNRVEWSDELYHIYGLDRATFPATIEGYLDRVHPEDRERVGATVRTALERRSTFQLDERIVRPDGSVRVLETRGKVLAASQGRGVTMIGVCQDVTDARNARFMLEASEAKFATMFQASPVAICVIALDKGVVIDGNARFYEMLGNVPVGSVLDKSPRELGMWAEPGEMRDIIARLRKQGSVREIPVRYVTREGQERRALAALELMGINGRECAVTLFWRP